MRNQIKAIFIVAALWITNISFVHADAIKNIPYTFTANAEQTLDIYRPDIVSFARPVLVYIHGGAWVAGDKGLDDAQVKTYINQGVILVSLNYRLAPGAKFPDNIKDIYAASDWITSNIKDYGGDPNNMVMVGHSAGAHLAALAGVGTKGHPPLALQYKSIIPVDTAGFDLTHRNRSNLDGITHRAIIKTFGRRIKTLKAGSPLHQIEAGAGYNPFILFVSGERENAVVETSRFHDQLKSHGYESDVNIVDGASHKQMNELIFTSQSVVFKRVLAVLRGL